MCYECKDLLVQCHIFKKNIKGYDDFDEIIKKAKIYLKLEPLLDAVESSENYVIAQHSNNEIIIAQQEQQEMYKLFKTFQPKVKLEKVADDSVLVDTDTSVNRRKRAKYGNAPNSATENLTMKLRPQKSDKIELNDSIDEIIKESQDGSASSSDKKRVTTSHMAKWNTNTALTEKQKLWIWTIARQSEIKTGDKSVWKCSVCSSLMSSFWVLRKHIRDVHIINPTKERSDKRRGKAFMSEVRSCKTSIVLEDGEEKVCWKCKRCQIILKSESGCIKHLLYAHIASGSVDPNFIAKCKIQIEYDNGRPGETGWSCPECKRFYRTTVGMKNHLKKDHRDIDFGGEKYQKKMKESAERSTLLKKTEKQCEIVLETESGKRKIWQCCSCIEPRFFKSETGFKAHIRNAHMQREKVDDKKIDECRVVVEGSLPKQKVWKCPNCDCTRKTRDGFISHVMSDHPDEFSSGNSDDVKPFDPQPANVDIKSEVLQKLVEQITFDRGGPLKTAGYKFACETCGLYFKKNYPTHLEAHKTFEELCLNYELPKCEQCRTVFCNDDAMLKHLEWHAEDSDVVVAQESRGLAFYGGKEFKAPSGTAEDVVDENLWRCGHCFAAFWQQSECIHHNMILHMEPLVCPIDNLEFSGNRGLALFCSHMKNKHQEMFTNLTYPCTYCNHEFATIFEKLSHMKTCDEKKLECDVCGRKFFDKIKLAHHLKIEKGLLRYECSFCFRRCSNSMDLKLHVIGSHTNNRLYACTFQGCEKTFKTSAARSSHLETHSDVTLKCSTCDSVFKKRSVLARHVKTMHDKVYR